MRPPDATSGLLLAQPDGERQARAVGAHFAGRVGLFLRVDDFEAAYARMRSKGVEFVTSPRQEPYGQVVVSWMLPATTGTSWGRDRPTEEPTTARGG